MDYFKTLRNELEKYLEADDIKKIHRAYLLAKRAHTGQTRFSGEPYITHPIAVAKILAEIHLDHQSIMAAIMHDVIEDTPVEKKELVKKFGEEVADLVDGVSKLTQIKFETRAEAQAENFRKMVLAMVRDIRVIIIKLADRLHNMRTLQAVPKEKQWRIARETLEIYAPIAKRLGMHNFHIEFEDLGFSILYPMRYRVLKKAVETARGNRREIISKIENALKENIAEHKIPVVGILGREKHLYSIYKKMRDKGLTFVEVMDVYAFRIIVDTVDTCYRILGVVHNLYKPLPERFKDYIAIPKANGYQSLHTTLFGPFGVPIEIQIRTKEMEQMADNGIAAHWLYKIVDEQVASEAQIRAREWLKGLLEIQQSTGNSLEFIENVKIDLFPHEVYVFTPKGHIMELPSGACPVDFAYAIHSDVGNSCVATKINRRLAPLSTPLSNGQTVEVITAPGARPNPAWLNFVVTGKARSNIRNYIKSQRKAESIALGKRLLENALEILGSSLKKLTKRHINNIVKTLTYESFDDLLEAIGIGNQLALLVGQRLLEPLQKKKPKRLEGAGTDELHPLVIKGSEGMVVSFAECCRPIPGDPIVGVLEKGTGLVIHHERCRRVDGLRTHPEKLIAVRWEENLAGEFKVDIRIEVANQRGVLAKLATSIADAGANIDNIRAEQGAGGYTSVMLTLSVSDRIHLAHVMRKIRAMKFVVRLSRESH